MAFWCLWQFILFGTYSILFSMQERIYDCAIIGGGIAGLSLAISLAKENKSVILFEKKSYPEHKVCGEYISNEGRGFLKNLGVDLGAFKNTEMSTLRLSSPMGLSIQRPLDIGGIGLSRYELDQQLYLLALNVGAEIVTNEQVEEVHKRENQFYLKTRNREVTADIVVGAFGKNSNMTLTQERGVQPEYIAVKYHLKTKFDPSVVEIHSFPGGYCGLSSIEDDKINMSYICKASLLKEQKTLSNLEKNILAQNPFLKKYFEEAEFILEKPLTISKLHFEIKSPTYEHMLMIGDAAGNIAPLSGNGMSIALLSTKLCLEASLLYLNQQISFSEMEKLYTEKYYLNFGKRIKTARRINFILGKKYLTDVGIAFLKLFPFVLDRMSKKIHGEKF